MPWAWLLRHVYSAYYVRVGEAPLLSLVSHSIMWWIWESHVAWPVMAGCLQDHVRCLYSISRLAPGQVSAQWVAHQLDCLTRKLDPTCVQRWFGGDVAEATLAVTCLWSAVCLARPHLEGRRCGWNSRPVLGKGPESADNASILASSSVLCRQQVLSSLNSLLAALIEGPLTAPRLGCLPPASLASLVWAAGLVTHLAEAQCVDQVQAGRGRVLAAASMQLMMSSQLRTVLLGRLADVSTPQPSEAASPSMYVSPAAPSLRLHDLALIAEGLRWGSTSGHQLHTHLMTALSSVLERQLPRSDQVVPPASSRRQCLGVADARALARAVTSLCRQQGSEEGMSEQLSALVDEVAQHAGALTPQHISALLSSLAAHKRRPSEGALSALLGATGLGSAPHCSPLMPLTLARSRVLTTVLHSIAHLGYRPHPRWLAAAAHALSTEAGALQDMPLHQSSSLLWSLAKLRMRLPR
jgi:hypothetical protein